MIGWLEAKSKLRLGDSPAFISRNFRSLVIPDFVYDHGKVGERGDDEVLCVCSHACAYVNFLKFSNFDEVCRRFQGRPARNRASCHGDRSVSIFLYIIA